MVFLWNDIAACTVLVWKVIVRFYGFWPASKRIFQSLLLKFELMRFQNMSAPCDNERAWRSWGTARDASWQNSDFNMDHKLEHKSTGVKWSVWDSWAFLLKRLATHTMEWASFPECRPGTGDDLCGQDTGTLHEDKGSSDSSSCWTKCLAPQTLTFP